MTTPYLGTKKETLSIVVQFQNFLKIAQKPGIVQYKLAI